jgi:polysaccharide chain length determinant protein (PEP-CTERM system associated)
MLPGKTFAPDDILRIVKRRRWYLIVPVFVCTFGALMVSRFLPNRYQSDTLIQIVPQRVPDSYVKSTVTTDLDERLKSITQQIMSRTRLEEVITQLDLYADERKTVPMEDLVARLRDDIEVNVTPPRKVGGRLADPDSFRLLFTYGDPQTAMRVTEQLASWFIAENSRLRGMQADSTNEFLDSQLADARTRLEAQEKKLEAFRERYSGRLPSQMQTNMTAIQSTQMQLQSLIASLETDRARRIVTERLYNDAVAEEQSIAAAPPPPPPAGRSSTDNSPTAGTAKQQLEAARQRLAGLELRLTAEHPDIRRTKALIADLEKKAEAEGKVAPDGSSPAAAPMTVEETHRRERISGLRAELDGLTRTIAVKEAEERRLRGQVADYQGRIESVPGLESEWISLSRDYDTLQETYRGLLQKSEESKVAANLERRQIGEQFRVLDPPRVPTKPKSPQRLFVNAGGIALGLLIGLAIAGLLEFTDATYRRESDVVAALSLPVLAIVPNLPTAADLKAAARRRKMVAAAVAGVLVASAGVAMALQLWRYVA